jgi:hypothetical protein
MNPKALSHVRATPVASMDRQGLAWYFIDPLDGNWQIPITSYLKVPTLTLLRAEK